MKNVQENGLRRAMRDIRMRVERIELAYAERPRELRAELEWAAEDLENIIHDLKGIAKEWE